MSRKIYQEIEKKYTHPMYSYMPWKLKQSLINLAYSERMNIPERLDSIKKEIKNLRK